MRVLIADDSKAIRVTLADSLTSAGHDVTAVDDGASAKSIIQRETFDCAILDIKMPGADGITLMKEIRTRSPETEVIMMTGHGTMESVLEALRIGAWDYMLKPFDNDKVVLALKRLQELRALRRENQALKQKLDGIQIPRGLIGRTPEMIAVYDIINTVAPTDASVLITGESGTGKELVADELHRQSARKNGPLVKFSCAALPESLIESELFGHEKGAFTGADRKKPGRFTMADGGTIFLDDVDDVPLGVQAKLLRVVEEHEVWPIGGKPFKVDIRIVAATKVDLAEAAERGTFRSDLYFRLNVVRIDLPPLRTRTDDIPLLIDHFIRLHGMGRQYEIAPGILAAMNACAWPGNVRELENAIERAIALTGEGPTLAREHLVPEIKLSPPGVPGNLAEAVAAEERRRIKATLEATGGRKNETAGILGISRKTLWEKMKKLGIEGRRTNEKEKG